jgi:hypothetical protein
VSERERRGYARGVGVREREKGMCWRCVKERVKGVCRRCVLRERENGMCRRCRCQ